MFKINIRVILFTLFILALIICSVILSVMYFVIYPSTIVKGNGNLISEKRNLTKFTKINVSDKINLNITQGTSDENLDLKAEDNIIKQIKTEVNGDTLNISFAKTVLGLNIIDSTKEVTINLNYKDLQEISLSGNSILKSSNKVRSDKLKLTQSGNSSSTIELFVNSLISNTSGLSTSFLTGSAISQEVNISGSGKYIANDLDSKDVKISLSGDGNVKIRADESLDINVSGSGSLEYSGNPKKLTQNISGTGSAKQISN
ncbi:MAG: head GIN domain-containing protein [Candidatus Dojkabacteria bacterium]